MVEIYRLSYSMKPRLRDHYLIPMMLGFSALFLATCGNLPQPFERDDQNKKIVESILTDAGVMIAPITNAPPPANVQLAERIALAAQDRDLVAVTRGASRKANLLQGVASTYRDELGGSYIRVSWQLAGPDGIVFDRIVVETKAFEPTADDPWLLYANSDLNQVVDETADFLVAALLDRGQSQSVSQVAAVAQLNFGSPYHLYVKRVVGAPGDGSDALTDALNDLLSAEGISIPIAVDTLPSNSSYVIAGRVNIEAIDDVADAISLVWDIALPDGQILGSVNQENIIPHGSLDGEWGKIAYEAAAAAADGLMSVLLQVDPLEAAPED